MTLFYPYNYNTIVGPGVFHPHRVRGPLRLSRALQQSSSSSTQQQSAADPVMNDPNTTSSNNNISANDAAAHHAANPWTVTLCILMVLLMCWCAKPNIPDARYRKDRSYWTEARTRRIQRSLHIRRIVAVDDAGNFRLGKASSSTTADEDEDEDQETNQRQRSSSNTVDAEHGGEVEELDDGHDNDNNNNNSVACCSICLETYRVGDQVAWTAAARRRPILPCRHVFHYQCLLSWLENPKHDDCPTCRAKILLNAAATTTTSHSASSRQQGPSPLSNNQDDPVDIVVDDEEENQANENEEDYGDDDDDHSNVSSSAFFIMHGLIARARRASYNFIGSSVSMEESTTSFSSEHNETLHRLLEPSPLRKAQTFAGHYLWLQHRRHTTTTSLRRRSRATSVSDHSLSTWDDDDDDPDDVTNGHFVLSNATTTRTTNRFESNVPGPVSLRRVASAGPSTPVRSNLKRNTTTATITSYRPRETPDFPLDDESLGTSRKATATTRSTTDADLPELSLAGVSSDSRLGRSVSLSSTTTSASLIRQPSSTGVIRMKNSSSKSNSIHEEYKNEPATMSGDDDNSVDSQLGLHDLVVMRQSVSSWARESYIDCSDTDRTDEDDIFRLESAV